MRLVKQLLLVIAWFLAFLSFIGLFYASPSPFIVGTVDKSPSDKGNGRKGVEMLLHRTCTKDERVAAIGRICASRGLLQWNISDTVPLKQFPNFIVDDKHRLLHYGFAKAASTTWLRHLVKAAGHNITGRVVPRGKALVKFGLRRLHSLDEAEGRRVLREYKRHLCIRHPFERLVSVWRDKFLMLDSPYRVRIGRLLIKKYRGNYTDGDTVSFEEFAKFVANGAIDDHWEGYWAAKACLVRYDFITRVETMQEDAASVLSLLGAGKLHPVHVHRTNISRQTETQLMQYKNVSEPILKKLRKLYQNDMAVFGYHFNAKSHVASCSYGVCC